MNIPDSYRSAEGERIYQQAKIDGTLIPLKDEPRLYDGKYWFVILNRFPWDDITDDHHLVLVLKRKVSSEADLTANEMKEKAYIWEDQYSKDYSHMVLGSTYYRSIKDHIHYHFINQRKRENNDTNTTA